MHMKERELQNISKFALLLLKRRVGKISIFVSQIDFFLIKKMLFDHKFFILKKCNLLKTLKTFLYIERRAHSTFKG